MNAATNTATPPVTKVIDLETALDGIEDGMTLLVGGFGPSGSPLALLGEVARRGVRGLTIVSNNAGGVDNGIGLLIARGRVERMVCSYPAGREPAAIKDPANRERVQLDLVPQGVLAERVRAGGAGLGGVLIRTGLDLPYMSGYEVVETGGERFLLAPAIRGDFALISAQTADPDGNLVYAPGAANFNPLMAMASKVTVAEVGTVTERSAFEPQFIHTPSIFTDRVVITA